MREQPTTTHERIHCHTHHRTVSAVPVRVVGRPRPPVNQINYRRRQQYFAEDEDVWDIEYTDLYDDYAPILGTATCQQVARKNSEAWRSHFRLLNKYHDDSTLR
jgi:putative transposase